MRRDYFFFNGCDDDFCFGKMCQKRRDLVRYLEKVEVNKETTVVNWQYMYYATRNMNAKEDYE